MILYVPIEAIVALRVGIGGAGQRALAARDGGTQRTLVPGPGVAHVASGVTSRASRVARVGTGLGRCAEIDVGARHAQTPAAPIVGEVVTRITGVALRVQCRAADLDRVGIAAVCDRGTRRAHSRRSRVVFPVAGRTVRALRGARGGTVHGGHTVSHEVTQRARILGPLLEVSSGSTGRTLRGRGAGTGFGAQAAADVSAQRARIRDPLLEEASDGTGRTLRGRGAGAGQGRRAIHDGGARHARAGTPIEPGSRRAGRTLVRARSAAGRGGTGRVALGGGAGRQQPQNAGHDEDE